ncbi:MAG: SpoIID/LytB domain-containing protein [Candidatus Manganitrophaceae bacterium]|nr:MAG: SpoIID/LytB domain-containing protein [Candidatus Manganitrophaceae bacterium]
MHAALIALFFCLLPTAAWAGETIRVALVENAAQVLVTSSEGFFIKTPSGERLSDHPVTSAEIRIQKGLVVNRKETLEKELLFLPRRGGKIAVNRQIFDGVISIKKRPEGLLVVNEIDIERYLQGVVPAEMPPDWEMEALKVQAVISRTYALYQRESRRGKEYDLVNSVLGQVYQGDSIKDSRASLAIAQTRGQVLTYEGGLALTFFHSTSAGPTEDASERWNISLPYLKGVSCPLDRDSPYHEWKRTISLDALESALGKMGYPVGAIATLAPLQWSRAGRLLTVRILYSGGELIVKAEDLRKALGYKILPSTHFTIDSFGREVQIRGMGYGHGVGLCQWGAKVMAESGLNFDEILLYYYPGVTLQSYEEIK